MYFPLNWSHFTIFVTLKISKLWKWLVSVAQLLIKIHLPNTSTPWTYNMHKNIQSNIMAHICLFAVAIFVSVYIIKIMSNQRKYLLIVESLICIPSMHSVRPGPTWRRVLFLSWNVDIWRNAKHDLVSALINGTDYANVKAQDHGLAFLK